VQPLINKGVWFLKENGLAQLRAPLFPQRTKTFEEAVMQEKRHIGLDLGVKSKSKVVILDETGERVRPEFSVWTTPQGLDYLMERALEGMSEDTVLDLTMESTNVAWFAVAVYLRRKYPHLAIYRVKSPEGSGLKEVLPQAYQDRLTRWQDLSENASSRCPFPAGGMPSSKENSGSFAPGANREHTWLRRLRPGRTPSVIKSGWGFLTSSSASPLDLRLPLSPSARAMPIPLR